MRIRLLLEDRNLERFARSVLLALGFHREELRVIAYPVGKGSAKQWVESQYPGEVRLYRSKANFQNVALLAGTDADEQSVDSRFQRLAQLLQDAQLDPRNEKERIVVWVPKWHIETWILHFMGDTRDEDHNYKHEVKTANYPAITQAFLDEYREFKREKTVDTLASLKTAYHETNRLER